MYLKEIKAQGFKSFADKTSIELNNGITGIVGPNGSGKSNVVDAIRWVMGEQSVKSLRGDSSMTDVIFSGSKSRNGLNVASVTLVFDNTDKYLPIDYTEVSIKRRVYQDGTNEYFINNEKCRLKDITDILLDSGMAKESFNIISQGKIEEILSNKPEERRVIFEEAAGVLKYKKRKEEALRKLDRTHNNMSRVTDIINELKLQVEPLRIQKELAHKYIEAKNDLENLEIALITKDITNINDTYQINKKKIDLLNEEIIKLSTNNSSNEVKSLEYKNKINDLNNKINNLQNIILESTRNLEKLNSQKQIILERKKYEVEDSKLHDNILNLTEQTKILDHNKHTKELLKDTLEKDILNLNKDILEMEANLDNSKIKKNHLESEISSNLRIKSSLENKIENLKEAIDTNSILPFAVKSILNNPKLRGIHNAIGNILEISEKYQLAISISLGSSASFIVTDNETCAKEAISHLKNNNIGRATFFPINVIKSKFVDQETKNTIYNMDGYIGIASDIVKYDTKYDNIIKNQLGNVLVVDNIDNANVISKKINHRYKIVTLTGELLHIGGSISGGNTGKTRNIITDRYELDSLIKEHKNINERIIAAENVINLNDTELKNIEDKIYVLSKEKASSEHTLNNIINEISTMSNQLTDLVNTLEGTKHVLNNTLSTQEEQIINSYYDALKTHDNNQQELDNLVKERANISDSIEEFENTIKHENSAFNIKNKELKDLEIEVNRADVKLDNLLNTLNETYSITYEKAKEIYILEIEETIARSKVNSLKRTIKELGIINLTAPEEYERVNTRYEFLINQKEDLLQAENTLLEIINEMDQIMETEFIKTFEVIKENFSTTFKELFKGGTANLKLTDPKNLLTTGIEIIASPPGKKLTSINLLSGGEKTFTAISLLFAILKSRPVPFCVLDEVEAALDEVNVDSFGKYIINLKEKTQFILITHKKKTMEYVDTLYGITMQESGVSKLVSVKLEDLK